MSIELGMSNSDENPKPGTDQRSGRGSQDERQGSLGLILEIDREGNQRVCESEEYERSRAAVGFRAE